MLGWTTLKTKKINSLFQTHPHHTQKKEPNSAAIHNIWEKQQPRRADNSSNELHISISTDREINNQATDTKESEMKKNMLDV